ncbi:NUDIX domain-containing protein [Ideonella livida]|uniref:NUDIX domain-containing protein n=1 Tax=Ideonella livida TaxID=2707176 RepID=A0A7C9TLM4_9BURK|nr:NUDIX domain-containing protein [Ideonella livida]NDY93481.1 NUDIX domain-containing protein [Ideonella livida]
MTDPIDSPVGNTVNKPVAPGAAPAALRLLLPVTLQPLLPGHLQQWRQALARARQVVLLLTGQGLARSQRAPFTPQEQRAQLDAALAGAFSPQERARLQVLSLREDGDPLRWARRLQAAVQALDGPGDGAALPVRRLGGGAHARWRALDALTGWAVEEDPDAPALAAQARALRQAWWTGAAGPDARHCGQDPTLLPAVRQLLAQPAVAQAWDDLADEGRVLAGYRQAWACAPYPPVFVTVDAVVQCAGHVLMIRRGQQPGRGLWALPGGFLEQEDTVLDSALRELVEETHLDLSPAQARAALRGQQVFDDPQRSQRGRTVTHGFYFDLGLRPLPPIEAGDDAAGAHWLPLAALPALEGQCLDDHFLILDHFLGLLPPA